MRNITAAVAIFISCCCAHDVEAEPAIGEYIYVESNIQTAGGNSILAYARAANGVIAPIPGSPFPTNGAGVQDTSLIIGPYDSDQEIVIDRGRKLLLAVNSGSDTIAVFHLNDDGSLRAVPGSPFPSGGVNPVSLAILGDVLLVANKNGDYGRLLPSLPNYTTFHIEPDGSLSPFKQTKPIEVAFGSSPSQVQVAPGTNIAFGVDFRGGLLQSFLVNANGQLLQRLPVPLPADPTIPQALAQNLGFTNDPQGLWTHPFWSLAYVGFAVSNRLGIYSFDQNGGLSFIRSVPVSGVAPCWVRVNHRGTRLYTSNTGTPLDVQSTISVFDLSEPTNPREIQNIQLATSGNATQIALNPAETTLYVISQRHTQLLPPGQGLALHVFDVRPDGTLVENVSPIPFSVPSGSMPQGVAVYSPSDR